MGILKRLIMVSVTVLLVLGTTAAYASACACMHTAASSHECCKKSAQSEKSGCHKQHAKQESPSGEKKSCCCGKMAACKSSVTFGAAKVSSFAFELASASLPVNDLFLESLNQTPPVQPPQA